MARYTIEIKGHHNELDMQPIRHDLEAKLSKRINTYGIKCSVQKLSTGIIFLKTELDLDRLKELLAEIRLRKDVRDLNIKYGWAVPVEMAELVQLEEIEWDPYYFNSQSQIEDSRIYVYSSIDTLVSLAFLCFVVWNLYAGFTNSNNIQIFFGLTLTFGFLWSFFLGVLYIKCDALGIEFRYIFKATKKMLWSDIQLLKIKQRRAEFYVLQTDTNQIEFSLSQCELLKTIITRAGLSFYDYEGTGYFDIVYRRPKLI